MYPRVSNLAARPSVARREHRASCCLRPNGTSKNVNRTDEKLKDAHSGKVSASQAVQLIFSGNPIKWLVCHGKGPYCPRGVGAVLDPFHNAGIWPRGFAIKATSTEFGNTFNIT